MEGKSSGFIHVLHPQSAIFLCNVPVQCSCAIFLCRQPEQKTQRFFILIIKTLVLNVEDQDKAFIEGNRESASFMRAGRRSQGDKMTFCRPVDSTAREHFGAHYPHAIPCMERSQLSPQPGDIPRALSGAVTRAV